MEQAEKSNNGPEDCCYWYCNGPHDGLCTNCPSKLFSNLTNYDGLPRLANDTTSNTTTTSSSSSSTSTSLSPAAVHKQQQQIQLHKLQQQQYAYSESRCPIYNWTGPQTCILQYPGPYFNLSSALKKMKNHEELELEQQQQQHDQQQQSSAAASPTRTTVTTATLTTAAVTLLSQLLIIINNGNDNRIWTVFIIKIVLIITVITNNIQYTILRIAWTNIITNNNQFLLQLAGL